MLLGKKLVEEGHAYNRVNNIKLWTGVVEEALSLTNAKQSNYSGRFKEGNLWKTRPEIIY